MGDRPVVRPQPTHRTTQNKRTQTSMPRVGFEPTTPVFEQVKTVHAADRAATLMGNAGIVPQIRPQSFPTTSLLRHQSPCLVLYSL
jgi:hypothetical protein